MQVCREKIDQKTSTKQQDKIGVARHSGTAPRATLLEPRLTCRWLVNITCNNRNVEDWRKTIEDALDKTERRTKRPSREVSFRENQAQAELQLFEQAQSMTRNEYHKNTEQRGIS